MQRERLRLRHLAAPRGDRGRAEPLARQRPRLVEVEHLGRVFELDRRERERQAAAAQQRRLQPLRPEARENPT